MYFRKEQCFSLSASLNDLCPPTHWLLKELAALVSWCKMNLPHSGFYHSLLKRFHLTHCFHQIVLMLLHVNVTIGLMLMLLYYTLSNDNTKPEDLVLWIWHQRDLLMNSTKLGLTQCSTICMKRCQDYNTSIPGRARRGQHWLENTMSRNNSIVAPLTRGWC